MSQNSYDPNRPHQQPIDGGISADHAEADPTNPPPAPRRRWLWILLGVFGLGTLGLIICCGIGSVYFSRISSTLLEPTRLELNELTQVQSQSGEIQELSMNFAGTLKEAEDHPDFVILDATTESGPLQFSVKMNPDGSISAAYLITEDGTREELNLSSRVADVPLDSRPANEMPTTNPTQPDEEDLAPIDETERELRRLESELDLN